MTATRRNWILDLALGALCLAVPAIFAQSNAQSTSPSQFVEIHSAQSGSLAGRLTNLRSAPLAGVSIVLRNQSTGAEARAITAKNGAFRFFSLDAGEYTLDADAAQLGHGRLEGILITGGVESRVQAALEFEPAASVLLEAAAPALLTAPQNALANSASNSSAAPAPARTIASSATVDAPAQPPIFSRPRLSTSAPQLTASISDEPLSHFPLRASPAPDAIKPTAPLAASALPLTSAPPHMFVFPSRPPLQTQSAPIELALSAAQPNFLPLKPTAPALAATAVQPNLAQAGLLTLPTPPPAAAPASDPVTPAVSTSTSGAQLQALPASGRHWQQFLLDAPTASASADSASASYRGSQQSAAVSVDGASIGLAFGASSQRAANSTGADSDSPASTQPPSKAWTGGRGLGISEAAVREITTAAGNVEAEAMRSTGGRTTIRTQSGGNALHGQGFFFDRQNTWGAQNPYTQWIQNTGTTTAPNFAAVPFTPPDHETVAGLGIGGDIRRDKLFWFAALDTNHRNDPGISTVKNPSEFFALPEPASASITLLSAQLGESQNQALNDYLGVSASGHAPAGLEQLAALLGPAPRASAQWTGFARVDWQAAERHHFTLEGIGADFNSPGGGLTRVSET
ncbi:MAG TPA: carboxypeptidase-like regulatory domain-containing protein, partial [Terracidiphilus sp.]